MRTFLLLLLLSSAITLGVAATVFRSRRAIAILRRIRLVAFVYVITIVALAIWQVWEQGGL